MQEWEVTDERALVAEEARRTRELHWGIGYKRGLGEARQEAVVQRGFDDGFYRAALIAFCRAYADRDPAVQPSLEEIMSAGDATGEATVLALEALYEAIKEKLANPLWPGRAGETRADLRDDLV